ncbi:hypothetical protein AC579_91 [Pseudocercospora musae]|uniref:Uncharacterized protein n=1 Tax=Pseudocercospora musae TaxID=113226 RepID=A0A139IHD0_9PEZI|nr:hypothetical protein AC579_91 [Pseudocercospora musae]
MALSISGGGTLSLSAAQRNERNILARLQQSQARKQLYQDLWDNRRTIEAVTAHHLRIAGSSACVVQDTDTWFRGQFNICILVHVQDGDGRTCRKIFRCPMAHKVGEEYFPGAMQEKMRAEVATFAWIESNCPGIPIPRLHAFGLSNNLQFTHHHDGPGHFRDSSNIEFNRPYLLLDYVDGKKGKMLSDTLNDFRETDPHRMQNLFRGISRIMVSLAGKAQSYIGSLRFNDDGSITLASRPIFCTNSILESESAPRVVNRRYTTSGNFIDDMIRFREEAFRACPAERSKRRGRLSSTDASHGLVATLKTSLCRLPVRRAIRTTIYRFSCEQYLCR